jgi:4-amino-4-deoxy-L-arabinose transferase-like glycosyltransferase
VKNPRALIVDLVCVIALAAFCLTIALPRWNRGIDYGDEGFLAYGAVRVLNGEMPHRDFVSLQPPLSFYTVALLFKLFGTSLATMRTFGLSIFVAIALLLYAIARRLMSPLLALCAAAPACVLGLPVFNFVPFAVWQGIAITLVSAFVYLLALSRNSPLLAAIAGICTAASLLLRHDQAIYFSLSILALSILHRFGSDELSISDLARLFFSWLGGSILVLAPLALWWWKAGALPEMWRQLVQFPISVYARTSSLPLPGFSQQPTVTDKCAALLFYFPLFLVAVAASWFLQRVVRGRFARREAMVGWLLIWCALFDLQTLTRSDLTHLLIALPPMFLLALYCWRIFLDALRDRATLRGLASFSAVAVAAIFLWLVRPAILPDRSGETQPLNLSTAGIYLQDGQWLTDFVVGVQRRVPRDRAILALPYQPMLYFLCERHNPTRWNYIWRGDQTAAEHVDLVAQAKHDPPAVVFLTDHDSVAEFAPEIVDYIDGQYHRAGEFGRLTVYFPNESTP